MIHRRRVWPWVAAISAASLLHGFGVELTAALALAVLLILL